MLQHVIRFVILVLFFVFIFAGCHGSRSSRFSSSNAKRMCAQWRLALFEELTSCGVLASGSGKGSQINVIQIILIYSI